MKAGGRLLGHPNGTSPFGCVAKQLYWRATCKSDKLSIFFTFGVRNRFTKEFALSNMVRQIIQTREAQVDLSPSLREALQREGVKTYDYRDLIAGREDWLSHLHSDFSGMLASDDANCPGGMGTP